MSYLDERRAFIAAGRPLKQKKPYQINKVSPKRAAKIKEQQKAGSEQGLNDWFEYHTEHSKMVCENCGKDLSHYSYEDWRASQHHIIEKSKINGCPSVSCELENHGVLGKWCCHPQWHTSQENASKMPFFKVAKERFDKFKHLINEQESRKVPKIFL